MNEIALRTVTFDDLDTLCEFEQDPETVRRMNFPVRSREQFLWHWQYKILKDPAVEKQAVLVDEELAGCIVSWDAEEERMIGYWFGRPFWGRGIGTAAVLAYLDVEKRRPLFADPSIHNPKSVRLLHKCGFGTVGSTQVPNSHGEGTVEHVLLKLG